MTIILEAKCEKCNEPLYFAYPDDNEYLRCLNLQCKNYGKLVTLFDDNEEE